MIAELRDGRQVLVRPVQAGDGPALQRFVRRLSPWTRQARFHAPVNELSPRELDGILGRSARGGIALAALPVQSEAAEIVGLAEYAAEERLRAEFALVVADGWQRVGLGGQLTEAVAAAARRAGYAQLGGIVLDANLPMLALAGKLGFSYNSYSQPGTVLVRRALA